MGSWILREVTAVTITRTDERFDLWRIINIAIMLSSFDKSAYYYYYIINNNNITNNNYENGYPFVIKTDVQINGYMVISSPYIL